MFFGFVLAVDLVTVSVMLAERLLLKSHPVVPPVSKCDIVTGNKQLRLKFCRRTEKYFKELQLNNDTIFLLWTIVSCTIL